MLGLNPEISSLMQDDSQTMKDKIFGTIQRLQEEGVDLKETPALFQWAYPEKPSFFIQLMITEINKEKLN